MPEKKAAPQAGDAAQETKSVAGNDNARQSEPSDAQGLFELAKRQVEEEKTDEALKTLNKAIKLDSDNAEYYNLRGLVFFNKAVYGQALKNFSKAIELASDNADYYYNRAEVYRRSEDDQNAVAAFIDLDDLFGNYSYDGGELSIRDGNAREYYNSRSSNPNIQVANTLYILTKALENYDKAIELAPDSNADYYRGRAMIYGHNLIKYYSGAVKDIESAYALDPSDDLMEWLKREEGRLGGYKEGYKYKNILVRKN
ncbi:MAG: tetratricopeptide repeat protein [Spirochaetes bacterium]|nr:tetratricopeptide repeat protein [Spirochaetota bacterium]